MSIVTVTRFHAAPGRESDLMELHAQGRSAMLGAEGCESFDILREESDPNCFVFVQRWASRAAHDTAFEELILSSGHLAKVLDTLDEPIAQNIYGLIS
jgi:quinol monooxygenase YgiN